MLVLDVGYGSVAKMAARACRRAGARAPVVCELLPGLLPSASASAFGGGGGVDGEGHGGVLARVERALVAHPRVKIAVFDAVTSNTALRLPAAELARRGIDLVCDVAHKGNRPGRATQSHCRAREARSISCDVAHKDNRRVDHSKSPRSSWSSIFRVTSHTRKTVGYTARE